MNPSIRPAALGLFGGALIGCYLGAGQRLEDAAVPDHSDRSSAGGELSLPSGLPCEVATLLATYCLACHGKSSPSSGISLASSADLNRASKLEPGKTEAELALARMKAKTMPPQGSPAPGATAIAAFESWVQSGLPAGNCSTGPDGGPDSGPDPFAGPHVCTSGSYYSVGEDATMEPGNACVGCHLSRGEGPVYTIAGTVYPTGHEPSRCYATGVAGAQVVITDKNGATRSFAVNSVGNFAGLEVIALPFMARVELAGKARAMATPQMSGDCNQCHTENGAKGAPGRILIP